MNVNELYAYLEQRIPRSLSCPWDNDGLMCCPNGEREVRRVLFCLDVTPQAIEHAIDGGFDLIVSHHPLVFSGLKSISGERGRAARIIRLIKSDISVMSFHTRFDAVEGGVNDVLAELFELSDVETVEHDGISMMRVGTLPCEMALSDFADLVHQRLGCEHLNFSYSSGRVHRLALLGGGGGDYIACAHAAGADTYLSGELGYHKLTDCADDALNLVEAGHYFTERPALRRLRELVLSADSTIECEIIDTDLVKHI